MKRILFLTKNILLEKETQRKLEELDCEVYCSSDFLKSLQNNEDVYGLTSYFQVIILSITFSDEESKQILKQLSYFSIPAIRECELMPSDEAQSTWQELGIVGWIQKTDCIQVIREKIVQASYSNEYLQKDLKQLSRVDFQQLVRNNHHFFVKLSKLERRILKELSDAEMSVVSRKDLCDRLWLRGEAASHLSQLSMHTKRIREKYKDAGYDGETILTEWGKGYRLSENFHYFLDQTEKSEQACNLKNSS